MTVPDVVGDKASAAIRALRAKGLTAQPASVASNKAKGTVVSESPAAGASVAKGSSVAIRVSQGPSRVPNVVGQTRADAVSVLKAAGFSSNVFLVPSSQPKNTVVAQKPHAGTNAPRGSKVRLNVSSGNASGGGVPPPPPPAPQPPPPPASKSVPDVTGQPQEAAQRQLNAIGFTTPTAQRFDGFALDIEATEVGSIPLRNRLQGRLAANLRRSVGPDYPLGAIVPEAGALFWPGFPYAQTARYFDVFLPMAYFTFRVHGAGAVRSYVGRNISTIKSIVGADTPVHPIGGEADHATASEVAAYVRAARAGGAIGASLYDFNGTTPAAWSQLGRFPAAS